MPEWFHAYTHLHPKALGLTGDSITFAASLVLSLEALLKETERISIESKKNIVKRFPYAEDKDEKKLDAEAVERKWLKLWMIASRVGTLLLALGFACLLASRVWSE
jgi:hypothetical protein